MVTNVKVKYCNHTKGSLKHEVSVFSMDIMLKIFIPVCGRTDFNKND